MRRAVKAEGKLRLEERAKEYAVSHTAIYYALRGKTFKTVNEIEPPITGNYLPLKKQKESRCNEELFAEAISLRLNDPHHWTFRKLSDWIFEKIGVRYKPGPLSILLNNRSPELAQFKHILHKKEPKKTVSKPRYEAECVVCETSFMTNNKEADICSSRKCHSIIRKAILVGR